MRILLAGAALGTMLLASVAAAAGTTPAAKVIHTKAAIQSIAMGGHRVAYDLETLVTCKKKVCSATCNRVFVWDLLAGTSRRVSGKETCHANNSSTGAGVREMAIAGKRMAWIVNQGGNTESNDYLYTASLPGPNERRLVAARRFGDVGGILKGTWIGNLVGSGNLLAVNRWSTDGSGAVTRSGLDVIVGRGLRRVASSREAMLAQSADSGRIAVLRPGSSVDIYNSNGRRLRKVEPSSATSIALRGDFLLVLTKTQTLEIYNARSGAYLRSWPVPARAAADLDAYAGVVVYVAYPRYTGEHFKVHVLHLATGKDVVLATGRWFLRRSVELESAGLLYARDRHNLVFVPLRRVLAAVS
jgi:hypothetical protein